MHTLKETINYIHAHEAEGDAVFCVTRSRSIASLHILIPHIATRNRVHPYNYGNVYMLHFSVIVILANAVFFLELNLNPSIHISIQLADVIIFIQ